MAYNINKGNSGRTIIMKIKGRYPESAKLYAIFLSLGLVLAVAVFILVYNMSGAFIPEAEENTPQQTQQVEEEEDPSGYNPDEELSEEMKDAATDLLSNNYTILKLYYTKGMNHKDEPYGNAPEDGYYTVDSSKYSSLKELEELVDATFTEEQAEIIKTDSLGYGPIYKERENGDLGIIENFTPMPYERSWDNPTFSIEPVSDTDCIIAVTLHENGEEVQLSAEMVKTESGWKLTAIVF